MPIAMIGKSHNHRLSIYQRSYNFAPNFKKNNMIMNDSVKPEDQRELAHFSLARNRTFKNDSVKPEDKRELARFARIALYP